MHERRQTGACAWTAWTHTHSYPKSKSTQSEVRPSTLASLSPENFMASAWHPPSSSAQ